MRTIARNVALEMALQQRAIGRRIAQLRERARLTQEAAADRVGVTLRAYQKWEAGGGIQYANLEKLAEIFGTSVDHIVGNDSRAPDLFAFDGGGDKLDQILSELKRATEERDAMQALIDKQNLLLDTQSMVLTEMRSQLEAFARYVDLLVAAGPSQDVEHRRLEDNGTDHEAKPAARDRRRRAG